MSWTSSISNAVSNFASSVGNFVSSVTSGFTNAIQNAANSIYDNIVDPILSTVGDGLTWVVETLTGQPSPSRFWGKNPEEEARAFEEYAEARDMTLSEAIQNSPEIAAKIYGGSNGLSKLLASASELGTDVVGIGEGHANMSETFSDLAKALEGSNVGFVGVELPPEHVESEKSYIRAASTKNEYLNTFDSLNAGEKELYGGLYTLVKKADNLGVDVGGIDKGYMPNVTPGGTISPNDAVKRLDDKKTVDYLLSQDVVSKEGETTVIVYGGAHYANTSGKNIKGIDDLLEQKGYDVLTMFYTPRALKDLTVSSGGSVQGNSNKTQLDVDAFDVALLGSQISIDVTYQDIIDKETGITSKISSDATKNDDFLLTNGSFNNINSGNGSDYIFANEKGKMTVNGAAGIDTVSYITSASSVTVDLTKSSNNNGAAKGDVLINIENITGTNKGDKITGNWAKNVIYGEDGNDTISGKTGDDRIYGGNGRDTINGDHGNDKLSGNKGIDTIRGGYGNDHIRGGDGNDKLYGENGDDAIYGGNDNDNIYGGDGADDLNGNDGSDRIRGGNQNDIIHGNKGNDKLFGDNGNDKLYGGYGADQIEGNNGNDRMRGGDGGDTLRGGSDNDMIFGDGGNDKLYGDSGNDMLFGGIGNDTLRGGGGKDIFVFEKNEGYDRILDFENGKDLLDFKGASYKQLNISKSGSDVKIAWGKTQVTIEDINISQINANDFV